MARAHLYKPIQDAAGNLRQGATVRVFAPGTSTLTTVPLFSAASGTAQVNPTHTVVSGIVDFYTEQPERFRIGIKVGDEPEVFFENVDCLEPSLPADGIDNFALAEHTHEDAAPVDHTHPGADTQPNQVNLAQPTASATLTDEDYVTFFDGTDLTATLPTAVGRTGRQFVIKNLNASALTVATEGGTIDATATRTLAQYDSLTIISNGANWSVV